MKYFIQFEGNEKLIIKIILGLLIITACLLSKIAFTERPIYVELEGYYVRQENSNSKGCTANKASPNR